MTERVLKEVPSHVIVFIFVSGLCTLLLNYFFYSQSLIKVEWVNPFYQTSASEALASVALTTVFSFVLGAPIFLCRRRLIGNGCWVKIIKNEKVEPEKLTPQDRARALRAFVDKQEEIKKNGLKPYADYNDFKYQIINGAVAGSEIAILINSITTALTLALALAMKRWIIDYYFSYGLFLISVLIFFVLWRYDKRFEDSFREDRIVLDMVNDLKTPSKRACWFE